MLPITIRNIRRAMKSPHANLRTFRRSSGEIGYSRRSFITRSCDAKKWPRDSQAGHARRPFLALPKLYGVLKLKPSDSLEQELWSASPQTPDPSGAPVFVLVRDHGQGSGPGPILPRPCKRCLLSALSGGASVA